MKLIGGHEYHFVMWPFYMDHKDDIGTENPKHEQGSFPFYDFFESPRRDQKSILVPFFSWIDDRDKQYREKHIFWPFVVLAEGAGKQTKRVFPFYSKAHVRDFATVTNADTGLVSTNVEADLYSGFFMWPVYRYNAQVAAPLDRHRARVLFYLYSTRSKKHRHTSGGAASISFPSTITRASSTGTAGCRCCRFSNRSSPATKAPDRDYSPLWSFWRSEHNPATGASSRSLLWNFYRHDATPTNRHTSAVFGLYQSDSDSTHTRRKLFFIPF